jgi:hypothetical protein
VDWLVEANVSEKSTVSIFRAEVRILHIGPAQSLPHSIVIDPFLQTYLSATLYNPCDSQHRHFSPEDGDSTLLRNVGFYQSVHTAPKPRTSSSKEIQTVPCKTHQNYSPSLSLTVCNLYFTLPCTKDSSNWIEGHNMARLTNQEILRV